MRGESLRGGTLTLELPAEIVKLLAKHADTLGLSIDAPVYSSQLLGGLLNGTGGSYPAPSNSNPENPYATTAAYDGQQLRKTLGVKATDVGRGVGVAIIDSGIAPTPDLDGPHLGVLRLHRRRRAGRDRAALTATATARTSPA